MERIAAPSRSGRSPEGERTRPAEVRIACRAVTNRAELTAHLKIRRATFVREQGLFEGADRDEHDDDPATIHVLGFCDTTPSGTVRLYPLDEPGLWKGDRLAVLPEFRRHGVGAPLVRFAVSAAARLGGTIMVAQIQPANVAFFERLGWERRGEPAIYVGRLHQPMAIGLAAGGEGAFRTR